MRIKNAGVLRVGGQRVKVLSGFVQLCIVLTGVLKRIKFFGKIRRGNLDNGFVKVY
jgi:hypothetical protein